MVLFIFEGENKMEIDKNINKRFGRFYISSELLFDNYDIVNRILSQVIVVECTHHYYSNQFEYIAISPLFDVVDEGCKYNEYEVLIADDEIKFEKADY
ncbi:hypothetical protein ACQKMI_10635 [Lysinibacillus sp. NPDC097214]|uniref:hypothetical protein n=1 Tax=Lysinibacillus sp. NPDC097214 TaxID=3390584 RepID=UPI003D035EA2